MRIKLDIPDNRSPSAKPISLAPLTPADALRRAMSVPAPAADPKPAKAAAKKKTAKKPKK